VEWCREVAVWLLDAEKRFKNKKIPNLVVALEMLLIPSKIKPLIILHTRNNYNWNA
jgi:hypothetical protein